MSYQLKPSGKATKKYDLIVTDDKTGRKKTVSFGAKGMSDYTIHKDDDRKQRYLKRHQRESSRWTDTKENLKTPSYLAKNLLWNKPSLTASIKDVERRQGITIKR